MYYYLVLVDVGVGVGFSVGVGVGGGGKPCALSRHMECMGVNLAHERGLNVPTSHGSLELSINQRYFFLQYYIISYE